MTVAAKHDHPDVAVPRNVAVGDTAQLPGRVGQLNYRYVAAIVAATVFLAARKYLHNACVARARSHKFHARVDCPERQARGDLHDSPLLNCIMQLLPNRVTGGTWYINNVHTSKYSERMK